MWAFPNSPSPWRGNAMDGGTNHRPTMSAIRASHRVADEHAICTKLALSVPFFVLSFTSLDSWTGNFPVVSDMEDCRQLAINGDIS
jgi:hypothetical protein